MAGAAVSFDMASQTVLQHNFVYRMPEVAAAQVLQLLHQGNLKAAANLAQTHKLTINQARVHLSQGDTGEEPASLKPLRQQKQAKS